MRIAIQGEPGSFSHAAALQFIHEATAGEAAEIVPCALSAGTFEALRSGAVQAVVIPVENALAGSVVEHYDLLREHEAHIAAETVIPIVHNVIGMPGSTLDDIERVYSHPVALAQCRRFFQQHPGIDPVSFYDTAGAVRHILEAGDRRAAAIAGSSAAALYRGTVLAAGVEDDPRNFTRFLLVLPGAAQGRPPGRHKLSLCILPQHVPGSLAAVMERVASEGGNLTMLQSRPLHGSPWHYHFFLDALMPDAAATDRLLERLAGLAATCKVLGRFEPDGRFY
jgi:prephenate dehydratase